MTNGFSGADITSIVNTAVSLVLPEYLTAYPKPEDAKKHTSEAAVLSSTTGGLEYRCCKRELLPNS